MLKKYFVFLLCLSNACAMELSIVQTKKQKISYEKRLHVLCAQQFSHLNKFSKSIELTIQKQNNKNVKHKEYIEAALRIGCQLPKEVQREIFSYVFETEIPEDFFKNESIISILHFYADDQEFFELYKEKWLVVDSDICIKRGVWHHCIMFNYNQFLALPLDERLLLKKIIKNSTVTICNDIAQLSKTYIYDIPSRYKIALAELPIVQKILEKKIEYDLYDSYDLPLIKNNKEDLAKQLKIDIEYDGPTIKDKILVIVPLLLSSALPNAILYSIDSGINVLVPGNGWTNWGVTITGRLLGFVGSIVCAGYIGNYLFPALDKYNSGVVQLKKFFGNKVRMNIKQEDLPFIGGIHFLCAVIEHSAIISSFLPMNIVGYVIRGLRLWFINRSLYKNMLFENPIKRGAPVENRSWGVSYNLRHMQKEK